MNRIREPQKTSWRSQGARLEQARQPLGRIACRMLCRSSADSATPRSRNNPIPRVARSAQPQTDVAAPSAGMTPHFLMSRDQAGADRRSQRDARLEGVAELVNGVWYGWAFVEHQTVQARWDVEAVPTFLPGLAEAGPQHNGERDRGQYETADHQAQDEPTRGPVRS